MTWDGWAKEGKGVPVSAGIPWTRTNSLSPFLFVFITAASIGSRRKWAYSQTHSRTSLNLIFLSGKGWHISLSFLLLHRLL